MASTQSQNQSEGEPSSTAPTLEIWGETVQLKLGQYRDGSTAIQLETTEGEPFATISVWFPESAALPRNVTYVKDWSENERIVPVLADAGWITEAPEYPPIMNGWVTAQAYRVAGMEAEQAVEQEPAATGHRHAQQRRSRQAEMG